MKINIKSSKIKQKICETCGLKKSCGDLSGFCILLHYVPVVFSGRHVVLFSNYHEFVSDANCAIDNLARFFVCLKKINEGRLLAASSLSR